MLPRTFTGYNRPPCPSCPTWPSSPTRSMLPQPAGRLDQAEVRSRWSCAARRPSWRHFSGQLLHGVTRRGKFLVSLRARSDRPQPDADRPAGAGRRRVSRGPDGSRAGLRRTARGGLSDRRRQSAAGRSGLAACSAPNRRDALSRRDADGQALPAAGGSERPVAGWDEQGPDADDPALTLDEWRRRIGATAASSRTCCATRRSWPASATPTATRSCGPRAWRRSERARRSPPTRSTRSTATREVLAWAIERAARRVPPRLEVEQRGFLRVHGKGGEPCPRCGDASAQVTAGGFVTNFCRGCQR
jgi:hypothetical protein